MSAPDDLRSATDALGAGRWRQAQADFTSVLAAEDDPRAQDGLAQAAWWLDDAATTLTARESAYRGYRARHDDRAAALAAATLGYDSMLFGAGIAVGRGWIARATELIGGRDDVPEAGWLAVRRAEIALSAEHDAAAAARAATTASQIGRRCADGNLVFVAQALAGLADVRLGRVSDGLAQLDAAAAAATAGDVTDLMWVGKICCWLITACRESHDLVRASEWCLRVAEICERRDLAPLFSVCRTQYASVLLAQGDCAAAESTLAGVVEHLAASRRATRLEAVAQLGELRRRQGRYDEAESLLAQADTEQGALQSLALVRVAQGDPARGWRLLDELLRRTPPHQRLARAELLSAAVVVAVAAGLDDSARAATEELTEIAAQIPTHALRGAAAGARARLASGERALELWQEAVRHLRSAGLRYDEAEARLELAAALATAGDLAQSRDEARAALAALVTLQTGPAIARARLASGGAAPLTARQAEVLQLLARGLSNGAIAAELSLSQHTVHRHVANIYATLGIASRAAATRYAATHDLI